MGRSVELLEGGRREEPPTISNPLGFAPRAVTLDHIRRHRRSFPGLVDDGKDILLPPTGRLAAREGRLLENCATPLVGKESLTTVRADDLVGERSPHLDEL